MIAELSQEEKRTAIAKECGWTITQIKVSGLKDVAILPPGVSAKDEGAVWTYCGLSLPDYFGDLNAMHEAEKVLTNTDFWRYHTELARVVKFDHLAERKAMPLMSATDISATAAQRAEAFGKTLNLW